MTNYEGVNPVVHQLQAKLDGILTRELTVDTIATFGEDAIKGLSDFSIDVRNSFHDSHPDQTVMGRDLEDMACLAYGFPSIAELLDLAQQQDNRIKEAENFMTNRVTFIDRVITPPDQQEPLIASGANTYEKPGLKNKLMTLLYVVQELGVSLENVSVAKGEVPPSSMRRESYARAEIPDLQRVVYICDEDQNASFVFDSNVTSSLGLTVEELDDMTKKQKNELIELYPEIGHRFLYRSRWVDRLRILLSRDFTQRPASVSTDTSDPWFGFWESLEDGKHYGNFNALVSKLTIGKVVIERFINDSIARHVVQSGGKRWRTSDGYAFEDLFNHPEIQKILAVPLTERTGEWINFYQDPETGHHYGSVVSLERRLKISSSAIMAAVERNGLLPKSLRGLTRLNLEGYSYESLLSDEKIKDLIDAPVVSKKGQWKGFWTDTNDAHWGPTNAISSALGVHFKIIQEIRDAGSFPCIRTRGSGEATDSYRFEDFVDHPRILELATSKLVEVQGEWKGFYTDQETGEHWAPLRTIANRLGTTDKRLRDKMEGREVRTITVRSRTERAIGGTYTAYCIEQLAG